MVPTTRLQFELQAGTFFPGAAMPSFNRILVVFNPTAGQKNASRIRSAIEAFFMDKGYQFTLRETQRQDDTQRWARSASAEGFDLVVAIGGDGTLSEAADGIMRGGARVPLAVVPTGTVNFAARAMSVPTGVRDALEVIATGKVVPFDIGYLPEHDRYFIFIIGAGYDATLIHHTPPKLKKRFGFLAYLAYGIHRAPSVRPVRMEIELDDEVKHLRAHTVMAINIGSIASLGFSFAPDVDPHDGKLNIEIMSTRTLWGSFLVLLKILTRRYHGFQDLKHAKARRVRVSSDPPAPVEIDGDPLGTTPFLAEVIPDAISCLVPKDYDPGSHTQT